MLERWLGTAEPALLHGGLFELHANCAHCLLQLVAYEVTQLSPTTFEQQVVPHSIAGLGVQHKHSWIRYDGAGSSNRVE